jgi:alkylated DNA repair protein alkB family protein 6
METPGEAATPADSDEPPGEESHRDAAPPRTLACVPQPCHAVTSIDGVWVVPDWLTRAEELQLLQHVDAVPPARWTQLSGRAVQRLGGLVHDKAGLLPAPLPKWVVPWLARLQREVSLLGPDGPPLNHVLINSYPPGQGIMAHQDGPLYFPVVCILSLGAPTVMSFTPHQSIMSDDTSLAAPPQTQRVTLPPRSLLIFARDAYERYLHGIEGDGHQHGPSPPPPPGLTTSLAGNAAAAGGTAADAPHHGGRRVSLTCRAVLLVRKGLVPGT